MRPQHAGGHGVRRFAEQADERLGKKEEHHADHCRASAGEQQGEPGALLHPVKLPGADVLADKGGGGCRKSVDGNESEALQLHKGAVARHGRRAEHVDAGLDDDIGKGDHRILYARGHADAQHLLQDALVQADAPQGDPVSAVHPGQAEKGQRRAEGLGGHSGQRRAGDAHFQHAHQQQVQHHIGHRGQDEVIQRPLAVTHRLENAHGTVIQHYEQNAPEVDAQIIHRISQHLLRGVHQPEQRRRKAHAHKGKQGAGHQTARHGGAHGALHLVLVPGAERPGDDYTHAAVDTAHEAHQQKNQRAGGGDRRQGVFPHEIAHHQGVHHIIELLEHLAQKQGQGEPQQPAFDVALEQADRLF